MYQGDSSGSNASIGTSAGTHITGNGVLRKTGNGVLGLETYASSVAMEMSGGTIDIEQGTLRRAAGAAPTEQQPGLAVRRGSAGSLDLWRGKARRTR